MFPLHPLSRHNSHYTSCPLLLHFLLHRQSMLRNCDRIDPDTRSVCNHSSETVFPKKGSDALFETATVHGQIRYIPHTDLHFSSSPSRSGYPDNRHCYCRFGNFRSHPRSRSAVFPCQTQHRHCVAHLLFPDLFYKLPAGGSLNAIVRTVIPVVSIQIFLAVITIMLLVIRKYIR